MSNIGNKEVMAKNLRYHIDRSGKMQKDVAEAIDVPPSTFNAWLKAKKYPRIDKIEMLANYFGILKSDLIEEKTTHDDPIGVGKGHAMLLKDHDFVSMYPEFQILTAAQKKLVKDLVHNLSEMKKSEV